jgi:hypothetical protein
MLVVLLAGDLGHRVLGHRPTPRLQPLLQPGLRVLSRGAAAGDLLERRRTGAAPWRARGAKP